MEADDLVTVYTLTNPIEAEMIKNALHEEGIRCFLDGIQAAELGLMAFEIKVQVPAIDADRAAKYLEQHEENKTES